MRQKLDNNIGTRPFRRRRTDGPRLFRSGSLQRAYDRHGFVVVPLLDDVEVGIVRREFDKLDHPDLTGFFSSLYSSDHDYKVATSTVLEPFARKAAARYLTGARLLATNFVTKSGPTSSMGPHQDWTFVDERGWSSLNVWCPLMDVSHRTGALYLLDGGQRLPFTIRGANIPSAFAEIEEEVRAAMTCVPMRQGDALMYDHRLLHASPVNESDEIRVAAVAVFFPEATRPLHFRASEGARLERYEIDDTFFVTYTFGSDDLPVSTTYQGAVSWENPRLTMQQVQRLGRPRRRGREPVW